jgi:hypothetical protein
VAEGARLESVFRGNSNVGSNPTLSAIPLFPVGYPPLYYPLYCSAPVSNLASHPGDHIDAQSRTAF